MFGIDSIFAGAITLVATTDDKTTVAQTDASAHGHGGAPAFSKEYVTDEDVAATKSVTHARS